MQEAGCVEVGDDDSVAPTTMGRVASFYYLRHETLALFARSLTADMTVPQVTPCPDRLSADRQFSFLSVM
jgi:activating signal cointegrator complex subunit 3